MKNASQPVTAPKQTKLSAVDILKYIIGYSSVIFTAISLVLLIIMTLTAGEDDITIVEPSRFLVLYPFALCTSAASLVFKTRIKVVFRILIHYAVSAAAFYLFICSPIKNNVNPAAIIAVISVLYFIVAAIYLGARAIVNKRNQEEIPYQPVYGKATKNK